MNGLILKETRKKLGFTQVEFAEKLGVTSRTLIKYEKGEDIPKSKSEYFSKIIAALGNNSHSEHEVIAEDVNVNDPEEQISNSNGNIFTELKSGKYRIHVKKVPVKAFGSYLSHDNQDIDFFNELEPVSFTVDHIGKGNYICFEVQGESMNGGGINDAPEGAELLCRELGRHHWKDGFRDSPYGWVIVHKETVLYKDIKSLDLGTGNITLGSRSGLPQHPEFKVNLNDVRQIWKVIKRTY